MRSNREKMTIRKGKFYRNDVEVPIEHGNKEQIELLKRIEEMQEGFEPDEIKITKKVHIEFICVCGATNDFDQFSEIDEDDDEMMIVGETDCCHYCGLKFKVIRVNDPYNDYLNLKLIPKEDGKASKK